MQGPVATAEEVQQEMRRRQNISKSLAQDDDVQTPKSRSSKQTRRNIFGQSRAADLSLKVNAGEDDSATSFLSYQDAEDIENDLIEAFDAYGIAYFVHDNKRKITFSQTK